jgi:hypothetical protein
VSGVQAIAAGERHTVALKASTVAFGNQPLGGKSAPASFKIKNTGTSTLNLNSVSIQGPNAADFILHTAGMGNSLPPTTGSTTFKVTFSPTTKSIGLRQAWLVIANDDVDESSYAINLTGGFGVPNRPPTVLKVIPTQTVCIGTPLVLDLASYFLNLDVGTIYTVQTNHNPAAVGSTISGSKLRLTAAARGGTSITIRATDYAGLSVVSTFLAIAELSYPAASPLRGMAVHPPSRLADGSVLLSLNVVTGRNYQMECSSDLTTWTTVPGTLQAGADTLQWKDTSPATAPNGKKFYRLREVTVP